MSLRTLKDNWRVFPYYDESVLNYRFIDQVAKRPVIDKIIYRDDYCSSVDFEAAVEELVFRLNDEGFYCYQTFNHLRQDFAGLSASSIYKQMRLGDFPRGVKLTSRSTGWSSEDIDNWIKSRLAFATEDCVMEKAHD